MKFTFIKFISIFFIPLFLSCGKQEKELSLEELQLKADSILQPKYEQLQQEAADNLDKRRSIELKPMVDSLLQRDYAIPPIPVLEGHDSILTKDTLLPVVDSTL